MSTTQMTTELSTVQSIYEAFGRGDVAHILGCLADDVAWDHDVPSWGVPFWEPRTGAAAVGGFFADLMAHAELADFQIHNLLSGGNQVAAVVTAQLTMKATGRTVDVFEIHLWTFDAAGKVSRFAHVLDRHAAVAAFRGIDP
jgi:hypothetical protein